MNEELHADFVSHFTEFLVKYGQLLECCEKCHMDIAGQYLRFIYGLYQDFI